MPLADVPPQCFIPMTLQAPASRDAPAGLERPRKPRSTGGPEGPWWRRPVRPE